MTTLIERKAQGEVAITAPARLEVVDVLRGFSLSGILLAHAVLLFLSRQAANPLYVLSPREATLRLGVDMLLTGKIFGIFSLLFGLGFAVQLERASATGTPHVRQFLWRLVLLFGIGCLHLLVFELEILHIYAVVGLVLVLVRSWGNGLLLWTSIVLFAAGVAFAHYTVPVVSALSAAIGLPAAELVVGQIFAFRAFTVAAMFVLGLYLGRRQVFQDTPPNRLFFQRLLVAAVALFIGSKLSFYALALRPALLATVPGALYYSANFALKSLFLSAFYVAAIVLLHRQPGFRRVLNWLAPVGKMTLSVYVMQSFYLLFFFKFCVRYVGLATLKLDWVLGVTALFFGLQLLVAHAWLHRFRMGPLEWLWRSLLYLKPQALRRVRPTQRSAG